MGLGVGRPRRCLGHTGDMTSQALPLGHCPLPLSTPAGVRDPLLLGLNQARVCGALRGGSEDQSLLSQVQRKTRVRARPLPRNWGEEGTLTHGAAGPQPGQPSSLLPPEGR